MKQLLKVSNIAKAFFKPNLFKMTSAKYFHNFTKPIYKDTNLFYTNFYFLKRFSRDNNNNKDNNNDNDENKKDNKGTKNIESQVAGESSAKVVDKTQPDKGLTFSESISLEEKEAKIIEILKEGLQNGSSGPIMESEELKSIIDFHPLIFFSHPVLPYSTITINNPNRNDVFLGLALKYGKLTAVDEETTNIEDITVFFEKEDPLKKKEIAPNFLFGTVCRLSFNKQRLIIEGTEKLNRIKTVRQGKYKSYKSKDATELNIEYSINETYSRECQNLLENILLHHQNIISQIEFKENQFSDIDMKFFFDLDDIKANLRAFEDTDNKSTSISGNKNSLENKLKEEVVISKHK